MENECVLTSFDFSVINEIKQRAPELPAGYIFNVRGFRPHVFTAPVDILSIHFALVNGFFMRQARKHGKKVFVWTVNSPWMMRCMCRLGVHGIITDFPDRLADVVNVWTKSR
ncbi:MAG: hypothetical protein DWQ10_09445 [Calditrichaeota bacterium]|nr:MAG: hypothetical protein DWQ10_09445 [Calditrichota bacterium]